MKKSDCGIKLKKAENGGMDRAWIWRFWGAPVFCPEVPKPFKISTWGPLDLVAHDCGYPLSRYTCRATRVAADFLDFIAFCRCSTGVALHPLKISVSHPPPLCREVSHRNLGLKRCRATRGCRSYSCGCRATLCN